MRPVSDLNLLSAWRAQRDRDAMDQLVRRHVDFVYAAARRQVRDRHLAEDVTQAVFMLLMTKTPKLPSDRAVAVWLHSAARYASANARRMQARRMWRERRAAELAPAHDNAEPVDHAEHSDLVSILDDAIGWLPRRDREGVILCFFHRFNYGQIGATLGLSEEAARKRISRALERMREYFAQRGVSTSAAVVGGCLMQQSAVSAPPALIAAAANVATLSQLAGAASSSTAILNGVVHAMLITKLKLAAAACAAVVVGGALTATAIHQVISPTTAIVPALTMTMLGQPYKVEASDTLHVEFLGVAKWDAGSKGWLAIDGSKIDDPRGPFANEHLRSREGTTHQAMLHVSGQNLNGGYSVRIPQATFSSLYDLTPSPDEAFLLIPFGTPEGRKSVDIELMLADGEWKTIASTEHHPGRGLGSHETEYGGVVFTHVMEGENGGSMVYVAHDVSGPQIEVFATDAQGNEHRAHNIEGGPVGKFRALRYQFTPNPQEIIEFSVKVRPFNKRVTAKNVTVDPAHRTEPQITVEEIADRK